MMSTAIDVLSGILIIAGSFFVLVGVIGLLRLPDIYTRLHGASVTDTAGALFLILGMMLQSGWTLVTLKLLIILAIFLFTLPVAAHALARAALHERVEPELAPDGAADGTDGDGEKV